MNVRLLAAGCAGLVLLAAASSASAAVTVVARQAGNLAGALLYQQSYIYDFDTPINAHFSFVQDNANAYVSTPTVDLNGYGVLVPGISAPPPIPYASDGGAYHYETSKYETITSNGSATLTALGNARLTSFSLYMGSPDAYNNVIFTFTGAGGSTTLSGQNIYNVPLPAPPANGDQAIGFRVYYDFGGEDVKSISFTSKPIPGVSIANSFEFDGLAASFAVPEPSTWGLMIMGFGGVGGMLRAQRRRPAIA